jgi:prepilin-type N-terminal cleavage/methylation domain-containing protein
MARDLRLNGRNLLPIQNGAPNMVPIRPRPRVRGFTLIELLVVITIILIVSVLTIPTIASGWSHRQVSEAARVLQANLAGARDAAIRDNAPSGIRLIPDPILNGINPATGLLDPAFPLAYNRLVPIGPAPSYSEGLFTQYRGPGLPAAVAALPYPGPGTPAVPNPTYGNTTALMVYQAYLDPTGALAPPTNWSWNIRIGDKIQFNNSGPEYTVIGPMVITPATGNVEEFINWGAPGTISPLTDAAGHPLDFLLLVNGQDDNGNGWVDEGWDGVDNDGRNGVDDIGEWGPGAFVGS